MIGKYAYSLDGERYLGAFETRQEAAEFALEAARKSSIAPQTVFVGKMESPDPKASGHARAVLSHMQARAREEFGDDGDAYLANLSRDRIEELDEALELIIRGWLHRNELLPTFFKIDAISEHTVPPAPQAKRSSDSDAEEVHELGASDYSSDASST